MKKLDPQPKNKPPALHVKEFSLKLHFQGRFIHFPVAQYEGGLIRIINYVEKRCMTIRLVDKMCEELGFFGVKRYYYIDAMKKFRVIKYETDLFVACDLVKVAQIYVDHIDILPSSVARCSQEKELVFEVLLGQARLLGREGERELLNGTETLFDAPIEQVQTEQQGQESEQQGKETEHQKELSEDTLIENHVHSEEVDSGDDSEDVDYNQEQSDGENDDVLYEQNIDKDISEGFERTRENSEEIMEEVREENREEIREEVREKVREENSQENRVEDSEENTEVEDDQYDLSVLSSEDEEKWRYISEDEGQECYPKFKYESRFKPKFVLKQIFSTKKHFKEAINSHAVNTMRTLKITRNDKRRIYAKCAAEGCDWHIHCLKVKDENTYQIREYQPKHKCGMDTHCKNVTSRWLAKKYEETFRTDPGRAVKGFRLDCIKELKCHISKNQAYRTKKKALAIIEGSYEEQYDKLFDYANELREKNPGSTVILKQLEEGDSSGRRKFDRFYVGFKALMDGFLAGCRPFIGIDGTHLKGPYDGVLITAVSIDPNNCLFPIAYAVVWSETKSAWEWFLELLKEDLRIEREDCYTFMSDKQKGLIPALGKVFPGNDNRFCVRHMIGNMKEANFRGDEYEDALWAVARAATMPEFQKKLDEFLQINPNLEEWLSDKPAQHWSRSHFSSFSKCDTLLNSMCESFNSVLLEARERPILTMLEWIRQYLMVRLQECRDRALKRWADKRICPRIKKVLEKRMQDASNCIPMKSSDRYFEVHTSEGSGYTVDLHDHTCSCRRWDISGIPCVHAMSAISFMVHDPEDYVSECYYVETYNRVYAPAMLPLDGPELWEKTGHIPPLPPNLGKRRGRPKKARRSGPYEKEETKDKRGKGKKSSIKLKKQKFQMTCSYCGKKGHNLRGCKIKKQDLAAEAAAAAADGGGDGVAAAAGDGGGDGVAGVAAADTGVGAVDAGVGAADGVTDNEAVELTQDSLPSDMPMYDGDVYATDVEDISVRKRKRNENDASNAAADVPIKGKNPLPKGKKKVEFAPPMPSSAVLPPTIDKGKKKIAFAPPRQNFVFPPLYPQGMRPTASPTPAANIRGHAPTFFEGTNPAPFPIIVKDGKKFVTLSNLPSAINSSKGGGAKQK